jgi:metal-responsive CopG/Arc/MetJ family transcriptional regulator
MSDSNNEIQLVIALPFRLLEQMESLVERGYARNRNVLLAAAVENFISKLEEQSKIDAEFRAMASDSDFQSLNLQIANNSQTL